MNFKYAMLFVTVAIIGYGKGESSPVSSIDETTINAFLIRHDFYRAEVGVGDLVWSDEVAEPALDWTNSLSSNCESVHSTNLNPI